MSAAWLTALSSFAVVVIAVLGWCTRWLWRAAVRIARFLDDYFGEPGRPGVPERPGVMARLQSVEAAAGKAEATAAKVLAETRPNHGHSLRDVVHKIREDVADVKAEMPQVNERIQQNSRAVEAMRSRLEQFERQRHERDDHA